MITGLLFLDKNYQKRPIQKPSVADFIQIPAPPTHQKLINNIFG